MRKAELGGTKPRQDELEAELVLVHHRGLAAVVAPHHRQPPLAAPVAHAPTPRTGAGAVQDHCAGVLAAGQDQAAGRGLERGELHVVAVPTRDHRLVGPDR